MLEKLLEALLANTAALERQSAMVEKALANAGKTAPAAEKAATETAKRTAKDTKKDEPKLPTEDELKTAFGNYMVNGPGEKAERSAALKAMNEFFGVPKISASPKEKWPEALGYLKQLQAGEKPNYMNEGAAEEESPI